MLHYLALIALVFVALVLGVLLAGWIFLYVLSTEENTAAAVFAAALAIICVILAALLLTSMI